jgi:hypothetical protein
MKTYRSCYIISLRFIALHNFSLVILAILPSVLIMLIMEDRALLLNLQYVLLT